MIRLRTLGTLDLRGANGEEHRAVLAQPRRVALLAYLALATPRGVQRRDSVLALFWPELDSDRARNALGQAVHFLRRAIGPDAIQNRNGEGLAIDWSTFWCDAAAFEEALDEGRIADAIALYRGELLEGFHIADAPDFERWLEAERARLTLRYSTAVESLAAEREAAGDFHGAATHWRALAARDPYNSRLTLRLMRALKGAGDPAGALFQARQHDRLLRDELAIAPDPEVAALVNELRSEQPGPPPANRAVVVTAAAPAAPAAQPGNPRRPKRTLVFGVAVVGLIAVAFLINQNASPPAANESITLQTSSVSPPGPVDESFLQALMARGRNAEISRSKVGLATAKEAYERAMKHDPTFAPAYAGLASVYQLLAWYRFAPVGQALDSARIMALRGFNLDSSRSETRTAVARMHAEAGRFSDAEREIKAAIAYDQKDGRAHYWYAALLLTLGRGREAQGEAELALKYDSLGPKTLAWQRHAHWLLTGERPQFKIPAGDRRVVLKHEPGEPWALGGRAEDLARAGKCAEAEKDIAEAQRLAPDNPRMLRHVAEVAWWCGQRPRATAILEEMKARPDARDYGFDIALLHVFRGDNASAFSWLDQHRRWTFLDLIMLSVGPGFDPVRTDPRYLALMRRLGIRQ